MKAISEILTRLEEFDKILAAVKRGEFPINVTGTAEAQKAHLISSLCELTGRGALIVTYGEAQAMKLSEDLSFFLGNTVYIPPGEMLLYKVEALEHTNQHKRMAALDEIEEKRFAVASVESFLRFVMPKNKFAAMKKSFKVGDTVDTEILLEDLVNLGYTRVDAVEGRGQFAVRGGIVDIFSPDAASPFRIELFGDEIDSVREFDCESQLTVKRIKSASIIPALSQEETGSILSYIPSDFLIFLDEPTRISESAKALEYELGETIETLLEKEVITARKDKYMNAYSDMLRAAAKRAMIGLYSLARNSGDYRAKESFDLTVRTMHSYGGNLEFLFDDLYRFRELNYRIIVLGGSTARTKRLFDALTDKGFKPFIADKKCDLPPIEYVTLYSGSISRGFEYPLLNTVIISDRELFPTKNKKKKAAKKHENGIRSVDDLSVGDYVVHDLHGIGKYVGIVRLDVGSVSRDYIKIEYRGADYLYLPVNQLDNISKYIGGEIKSVRLSKLGGAEWSVVKQRVKESVRDFADKLIKLYAEREASEGHAFSEDSLMQRQFEDEFPYEETPDQLRSIDEMKSDMQRRRPMDRLLCGDVGFGKTEVAMRGAFKAVLDGYQVAYLVPTTILAQQHYNNFVQRMAGFGVEVRMLSRFCSAKEVRETLGMLEKGTCDIVVGTHKLLGKNVKFKKLGLLIVDEEQRFGVAHKERIKEIKKNVDVLTLSATPIPRTLHMAMTGMRDMSLLTTPPEERYPVQTYVLEYNRAIIQNAIEREIARGGQVYYLCNRVKSLDRITEDLRAMLPDARIAVAHGQMSEVQLEKVMMDVINGDVDVLACTTIIETGMDIPNVNTLIVENADNLGLAQLYQLRGRVGRSNRIAYAYLTFRKNKELDEIAEKRLRAIKEFTEFGAGFKIAMRDLELRGAGDVLGPNQHGFMVTVGYDMYCKLLEEAVSEAMGRPAEIKKQDIAIDIRVSAFIPDEYISVSDQRMEAYRKIAAIEDENDADRVEEEFEDRFGKLPKEAARLIEIAKLKPDIAESGIYEIVQNDAGIMFKIASDDPPTPEKIASLAADFKGKFLYGAGEKPYILIRLRDAKEQDVMDNITIVLKHLKKDQI